MGFHRLRANGNSVRAGRLAITTVDRARLLSVAYLVCGAAWAIEPLGTISGQSELQSNTGDGVAVVCARFGGGGNVENALQQDLFNRCTEAIQTGNQILGSGATKSSLGLNASELNAALQQVATEEASAPGTFATETSSTQTTNLSARLAALRQGARGVSLSGSGQDGRMLGLAEQGIARGQRRIRGGGAGDGEGVWNKLGVFVNGNYGWGDRETTAREDGFDFDAYGVTAGADYRLTEHFILGGAFGYTNVDTQFNRAPTVAGGQVKSDGYTVSGYGTYYADHFYIDGIVGYGWNDHDLQRRILYASNNPALSGQDRTATAKTDSDNISVGVGVGYQNNRNALTYGSYLKLNYLDIEIGAYRERGAQGLDLAVENQSLDSLRSVLGARLSYPISLPFGVLVPQGHLEWLHEFLDDGRSIRTTYVNEFIPVGQSATPLVVRTDGPDRDYLTVGVGASTVFQRGVQAFLSYETVIERKNIEEHILTAGVRLEL